VPLPPPILPVGGGVFGVSDARLQAAGLDALLQPPPRGGGVGGGGGGAPVVHLVDVWLAAAAREYLVQGGAVRLTVADAAAS